uniref:LIM/homeobox protein Awh n=1 Tax=Ascaris suum TaxID=6253 RepID=F1L3C2_ASCSU
MEVHQMLFEKAGSRPEELLVGDSGMIPTLCNAESSAPLASAFLPLGELATRQFTQLDCEPVQQASSTAAELNGGHQQQQTTTASTQLATIVAPTGAQLQSTPNDAFAFAKPTKFEAEVCSSCTEYILDRILLNVNSRFWHTECLRCSQCSVHLDQYPSCFIKEDIIYCKPCYNRQFGTKCSSCRRLIQPTDWVRRARSFVYHLACFACDQCKRQLSTGEEFALQDCRLLCKQHYVELVEGETGQQKAKTKRVRTTFAEEQLAVLQTHFQIDSNPDGADLERIATMTGLSKRVTQVWFQNSRARQKKYQGTKKGHRLSNGSGRSSTDPCSSPKSPGGDSNDGMIFPTSVLTSAEDAMVTDRQSILSSAITMDADSSMQDSSIYEE